MTKSTRLRGTQTPQRTIMINLRLSDDERDTIDAARGSMPRARWIREAAVKRALLPREPAERARWYREAAEKANEALAEALAEVFD